MFSMTASYAMRALSHLAQAYGCGPLPGRDLAEQAEIPVSYLAKILLVLKRAGFVKTTRGTGGGYRLAQPAKGISLMQIVEQFDSQSAFSGCLLYGGRPCSPDCPCSAHKRWSKVKDTYLSFLETTTLDQISNPASLPSQPGAAHESK